MSIRAARNAAAQTGCFRFFHANRALRRLDIVSFYMRRTLFVMSLFVDQRPIDQSFCGCVTVANRLFARISIKSTKKCVQISFRFEGQKCRRLWDRPIAPKCVVIVAVVGQVVARMEFSISCGLRHWRIDVVGDNRSRVVYSCACVIRMWTLLRFREFRRQRSGWRVQTGYAEQEYLRIGIAIGQLTKQAIIYEWSRIELSSGPHFNLECSKLAFACGVGECQFGCICVCLCQKWRVCVITTKTNKKYE